MQYQSIRLRHRQDLWLRDCTLITTAIRTSEGSVTDHYRYDADTNELYITPQSGDTDEHNKPGIVLEFAAEIAATIDRLSSGVSMMAARSIG